LKGGRDGRLVVVSRDLSKAADASAVAPTLRDALDDWVAAEQGLQEIANSLEAGRIAHVPFDPKQCAAPLIRLFMLVNDISLRNLIPGELAKGFGFLQSKGQTAFSPVAVTPDELGPAFDGKKVHLPLLSQINGKPFGRPNAGVDMTFDFPTLIAHAVKTRPLKGGAIIGSGTVSNRDADGGPGKPVPDGGVGYSCLAEIRTVETILHGAPKTPYLNFGDRVRIEMNDAKGVSIFGAIDHEVIRA
jgi:fumarylacetoacetate (FAA) hydrolase